MDHRGPEFATLAAGILEDLKAVFRTSGPVIIYPSSGTGAWEAALVNALSPGDRVLMSETGHFATLWYDMAAGWARGRAALGDWRHGADPERIEASLAEDRRHEIKAVCVVHNETSTGVTSPVAEVRGAIEGEPPGAAHGRHHLLARVDRLPAGRVGRGRDRGRLAERPDAAARPRLQCAGRQGAGRSEARALPKSYWDWPSMLDANAKGVFPYTPATNLLYGLRESLSMLQELGLEQVFARHDRHAEATRRAVRTWGLELLCLEPRQYSSSLTAVLVPQGMNADALRATILEHYDLSLGNGLGKLAGRVFRIGHLGDFNDLMLAGTLSGIEMGLHRLGFAVVGSGVAAALDYLSGASRAEQKRASAA